MSNSFDFAQFKANAIEQLKTGVPLSGKDGVLAPLLEHLLNSALEGEMDKPYGRSGRNWSRTGARPPSNWQSCSRTGSGSYPDNLFHLEFFDNIDNLAEPLWNLQYPKTAPKNNLTQFSLHYLLYLL